MVIYFLENEMNSQAFGLEDRGNRSVDCLPGTDVLSTCSSKSSAEATFWLAIMGRLARLLVDFGRIEVWNETARKA